MFWNKEQFYVWCFYLDSSRNIQKRFTDLNQIHTDKDLETAWNLPRMCETTPYFYFIFIVCFPKVEGVANVLYIEKSINLLISICFPIFSLETNQQMRSALNLISGVIMDMDIVSFNRCTKQTSRFFNVHFYEPRM